MTKDNGTALSLFLARHVTKVKHLQHLRYSNPLRWNKVRPVAQGTMTDDKLNLSHLSFYSILKLAVYSVRKSSEKNASSILTIRNCLQSLLLTLRELIKFYLHWNHQKT